MSSRPLMTDGFPALRVDAVTGLVAPDGMLDLQSAPRLKRTLSQLADEGCTQIVVDLSRVTFMDSTALAVLVGANRRLGPDGALVVTAAERQVLKLFELTGLDRTIRRFPTADAAIASLTGSPVDESSPEATQVHSLPLTRDAAIALGIAATAMPFAESREEQVERWLHAMLIHGQAAVALTAAGFTEDLSHAVPPPGAQRERQPDDREAVDSVTTRAHRIAGDERVAKTGTSHLLRAVIDRYGPACDRVLERHGVSRYELVTLLEAEPPAELA